MFLVVLDWEKPFDKVSREGLFSALKRVHLPNKDVNVLKSIYNQPTFKV